MSDMQTLTEEKLKIKDRNEWEFSRYLDRIEKDRIIPTEQDYLYRSQLINGYVHDQGAAMFGGVGGHAGIFSNANDLAKIMQMYLNYCLLYTSDAADE